MGWGGEGDAGGLMCGIVQVGGGDSSWWRDDRVQVGGVDSADAERDVEVDGSAGLVFGCLAMRDPDGRDGAAASSCVGDPDGGQAALAGQMGEVALDGLLGAPPQFPGGVVPDHVGGVVVA